MIKITAKDNPLIKHINKLIKSAKYRKESCEFIAEGVRLCEDAFLSDAEITALVVSETALEKYADVIKKISQSASGFYVVSNSLFSSMSDTKSPQGVLCVIKTLDKSTLFDKIKDNGKFLALDNVQDPSNLGTILRTAEAVGIDGIVMSKDCCDIYSPKVVRGSMGAVFRLPYIITETIEEFIKSNRSLTSYASVVDRNVAKITDIDFNAPCVVAIGNEGNGLKKATIEACNSSFTIPMKGRAESLNAAVAASIIIWELVK
ncbi:MAG: RNA methyltransferase [Ruminococcus sp.]|nr:RNA methyltransferase [Ruminococcus sp.]